MAGSVRTRWGAYTAPPSPIIAGLRWAYFYGKGMGKERSEKGKGRRGEGEGKWMGGGPLISRILDTPLPTVMIWLRFNMLLYKYAGVGMEAAAVRRVRSSIHGVRSTVHVFAWNTWTSSAGYYRASWTVWTTIASEKRVNIANREHFGKFHVVVNYSLHSSLNHLNENTLRVKTNENHFQYCVDTSRYLLSFTVWAEPRRELTQSAESGRTKRTA